MYFSESLVATPLAYGEGKHHGETCMSKMVHSLWKTWEVPHKACVADNGLKPSLGGDPGPPVEQRMSWQFAVCVEKTINLSVR